MAPNTAHAALRVLGARGLVVTQVGSGTFVTEDRDAIAAFAHENRGDVSDSIDQTLKEVTQRLADLESQLGQLRDAVNARDIDAAPPSPDPDLGPGE